MSLLSNKLKSELEEKEREIESLKRKKCFFIHGYGALSQCIDYQNTIIAILEKCGLSEIKIPRNCYLNKDKELRVSDDLMTDTIDIKVIKGGDK